MEKTMLAVDLGAGSGRVISGDFDGNRIRLKEEYRFSHETTQIGGNTYRNLLLIWNEVKRGLLRAAEGKAYITSIGIDSFTPDFCLIDDHGIPITNMLSYRTLMGSGILKSVFDVIPEHALFEMTGTQSDEILFLPQILYYILSDQKWLLEKGVALPLAGVMNCFLTGEACTDFTYASTSMLWDRAKRSYNRELAEKFAGTTKFLAPVAENFQVIGEVRPMAGLEQFRQARVINAGIHDTADAMFYLGSVAGGEICVNCGTWAAIGVIVDEAVVGQEAFCSGLTNYGLPDGRYMFGCVFPAMLYLQDFVRMWESSGEMVDVAELSRIAEHVTAEAKELDSLVITNSYNDIFKNQNKNSLETKAEIVRCIYESVALKLKTTITKIETVTGRTYSAIYLGGGVVQSNCFCEVCETRTGKKVIRSVAEATAAGNFCAQLVSSGEAEQKEISELYFC